MCRVVWCVVLCLELSSHVVATFVSNVSGSLPVQCGEFEDGDNVPGNLKGKGVCCLPKFPGADWESYDWAGKKSEGFVGGVSFYYNGKLYPHDDFDPVKAAYPHDEECDATDTSCMGERANENDLVMNELCWQLQTFGSIESKSREEEFWVGTMYEWCSDDNFLFRGAGPNGDNSVVGKVGLSEPCEYHSQCKTNADYPSTNSVIPKGPLVCGIDKKCGYCAGQRPVQQNVGNAATHYIHYRISKCCGNPLWNPLKSKDKCLSFKDCASPWKCGFNRDPATLMRPAMPRDLKLVTALVKDILPGHTHSRQQENTGPDQTRYWCGE